MSVSCQDSTEGRSYEGVETLGDGDAGDRSHTRRRGPRGHGHWPRVPAAGALHRGGLSAELEQPRHAQERRVHPHQGHHHGNNNKSVYCL